MSFRARRLTMQFRLVNTNLNMKINNSMTKYEGGQRHQMPFRQRVCATLATGRGPAWLRGDAAFGSFSAIP